MTDPTVFLYSGSCKGYQHFVVSFKSYTHGLPLPYLCRHSNTLLVSLNNRALTRDSYEARGAVVDRQVVTVWGCGSGPGSSLGFTADAKILEPVKPQNACVNEVVEVKIEEGAGSEFCHFHAMVPLPYALNNSRDRRRCVRIIRIVGQLIVR